MIKKIGNKLIKPAFLVLLIGCQSFEKSYNIQSNVYCSVNHPSVFFSRDKPYTKTVYMSANKDTRYFTLSEKKNMLYEEIIDLDSLSIRTFINSKNLEQMEKFTGLNVQLSIESNKEFKNFDKWFEDTISYKEQKAHIVYNGVNLGAFKFKSTTTIDSNIFKYEVYKFENYIFLKGIYFNWIYQGEYDGYTECTNIELLWDDKNSRNPIVLLKNSAISSSKTSASSGL
jgi:hypothetical protein